ncbi:MAG TPA: TerC family protein [candidate division Zixibacteria bacterium]|nr:TerC family protein [candidate division Zixibacteria bacterium]
MEWITDPQIWIALITLTALEIILGIDNIIFISILADKLPKSKQAAARRVGLALAMIMRIGLLVSLKWMMKLTSPLFDIFTHEISGRDLILIGGGLFLLAKSTMEIHENIEGHRKEKIERKVGASFMMVILQIMMMDAIFSLDSVITAIGMVKQLGVMVAAIVIAIIVMMVFIGAVHRFVQKRPTVKMLALSFLLLIGVALIGDGLHMHIPRGYIYFAIAFSTFVELLNQKIRYRTKAA